MANKTFVVAHPKLYLKVNGKRLVNVEKGTEISMPEKDAKSLLKQGKILVKGEGKKVSVGSTKKPTKKEQKKLDAEAKKLADAEGENDGEDSSE